MWSSVCGEIVLSPSRKEKGMTDSEAIEYILTSVGSATFGKERWFRQKDGTYYDRLFEDYVDLEEVVKRLVLTVWERAEE